MQGTKHQHPEATGCQTTLPSIPRGYLEELQLPGLLEAGVVQGEFWTTVPRSPGATSSLLQLIALPVSGRSLHTQPEEAWLQYVDAFVTFLVAVNNFSFSILEKDRGNFPYHGCE